MIEEMETIWLVTAFLILVFTIVFIHSVKYDFWGRPAAIDLSWIKKDWVWLVLNRKEDADACPK